MTTSFLETGCMETASSQSCTNCCGRLERNPVYDEIGLNKGDVMLQNEQLFFKRMDGTRISAGLALCDIYNLHFLPLFGEAGLPSDVPLCRNCTTRFSNLLTAFEDFNRVREIESLLAKKISKLEDLIRSHASSNKSMVETGSKFADINDSIDSLSIKEEPEDYTEIELVTTFTAKISHDDISIQNGPWVRLERLKPEDIPNCVTIARSNPSISPSHSNTNAPFCNDSSDLSDNAVLSSQTASKRRNKGNKQGSMEKRRGRNHIEKSESRESQRKDSTVKNNAVSKKQETSRNSSRKKAPAKKYLHAKDTSRSNKGARRKMQETINDSSVLPSTSQALTDENSDNSVVFKNQKSGGRWKSNGEYARRLNVRSQFWTKFYERKAKIPYPCVYCPQDFHVESERLEHMGQAHPKFTHPCSVCGMGFRNRPSLTKHACGQLPKNVHLPPYICEICGKQYKSYHLLRSHRKVIHVPSRNFSCNHCDYKAKSAHFLKAHIDRRHTVQEMVQCKDCGKICGSPYLLAAHFKSTHDEEGRKAYLASQARNIAKKREKRRALAAQVTTFVCKDCGVDFQTKMRLASHRLNVHDSHRKNKICEQCGKAFADSNRLKYHLTSVHTDDRPFVCDLCGRAYKAIANLKMHFRIAHDEEGRRKYNEYMRKQHQIRAKIAESHAKLKDGQLSRRPDSSSDGSSSDAFLMDIPGSTSENGLMKVNNTIVSYSESNRGLPAVNASAECGNSCEIFASPESSFVTTISSVHSELDIQRESSVNSPQPQNPTCLIGATVADLPPTFQWT